MKGHAAADAGRLPLALTGKSRRYVVAACAGALAFGLLLPVSPWAAVAWLVIVPLALAAPVWALGLMIGMTVLVPFDKQDALAVIGGRGHPGLLIVDALLLLGLMRIGWQIVRGHLKVDLPLFVGIISAAVCAAAPMWGIANGADISVSGQEGRRVVLGVGTFLLAWPLLGKRSARQRLVWILVGIGLALALWGLYQWVFAVRFTIGGDVGVRGGFASGQLQGGMYAYPVAVVLAWAALLSGQVRNVNARRLLAVILCLNAVCLLLTFERTLWAATAVGCVLVVVTSGAGAFLYAIKWACAGVAVLVIAAAMAPAQLSTALERWSLVGEVSSDSSFKYRLFESRAVADMIYARPITGSGFGATITWNVRDTFATQTTAYSHAGYLWLAWKIGIPAAVFFVVLLLRAVLRRSPSDDTAEWHALRMGSQAALLALLIVCLTFPVFNALGITALAGLLVAVRYSEVDSAGVQHRLGGRDDTHSIGDDQ
jgi:O-antigen ligase